MPTWDWALAGGTQGKGLWTGADPLHSKRHRHQWSSRWLDTQRLSRGQGPQTLLHLDCKTAQGFLCSWTFLGSTQLKLLFYYCTKFELFQWPKNLGEPRFRLLRKPCLTVWVWGCSWGAPWSQLRWCECDSRVALGWSEREDSLTWPLSDLPMLWSSSNSRDSLARFFLIVFAKVSCLMVFVSLCLSYFFIVFILYFITSLTVFKKSSDK